MVPRQSLKTEAMVKVSERTRAMRDAARFRRARHRKQINPKTCLCTPVPYDLCLTVRTPTLPPQIRFTRLGRIRSPFYRIIAIDSRKRRDGAPLEVRAAPARGPDEKPPPVSPFASLDRWTNRKKLPRSSNTSNIRTLRSPRLSFFSPYKQELGWYDPIKKQSNLNAPAIKAWLAKGAQPSDTVGALLRKSLIIEK